MAKLDQIIHDIHNELGADMLFIDVVGTDGLSIAAERTQNLDTAAITARFSLVEKLVIKVADKLHLGEVEDDLVSGTERLYPDARSGRWLVFLLAGAGSRISAGCGAHGDERLCHGFVGRHSALTCAGKSTASSQRVACIGFNQNLDFHRPAPGIHFLWLDFVKICPSEGLQDYRT